MKERKELLEGVRRVVVKLGTRMVTSGPNTLDTAAMERLATDIVELRARGYEIVLVTSGAIAAGMGRMRVQQRPRVIPQLQALASIGQSLLMNAFEKTFGALKVPIAQVLLTVDDLHERKRYVNVQNTLNELLRMSVLPILNENDSVGTEEVKVGDNDNLSSYVASLVNADLLVLFTDVDGLYDCMPEAGCGNVIPLVTAITSDIEALCGGVGDSNAVGGMRTKIEAARRVMSGGGKMIIANGRTTTLSRILDADDTGTLFCPESANLSARRHWIAMTARVRGRILIDDGAARAISRKKASLLPKGITGVEGTFDIGDVVAVLNPEGREIAKGVTLYSHGEIKEIKGLHSNEIDGVLGYTNGTTVIHRNDMVFVEDTV